jgi:hypothetical protein
VKPQKKQLLIEELESRGVHVLKNNITTVYVGVQIANIVAKQ